PFVEAVPRQLRPPHDRVQLRAELVGERREELVLLAVRRDQLGPFALDGGGQVRALDRARDPLRDGAPQLHLVVLIAPPARDERIEARAQRFESLGALPPVEDQPGHVGPPPWRLRTFATDVPFVRKRSAVGARPRGSSGDSPRWGTAAIGSFR